LEATLDSRAKSPTIQLTESTENRIFDLQRFFLSRLIDWFLTEVTSVKKLKEGGTSEKEVGFAFPPVGAKQRMRLRQTAGGLVSWVE
jgi:hypothetical protein